MSLLRRQRKAGSESLLPAMQRVDTRMSCVTLHRPVFGMELQQSHPEFVVVLGQPSRKQPLL
jgi:hypothetical protein